MQIHKILIALAIISCAATLITWPYLFPRSLEAHVNAPVTVVRAPVAGIYSSGSLHPGDTTADGQALGTIRNEIIDSQFLNELRTQEHALASEYDATLRETTDLKVARAALKIRIAEAKARLSELVAAQIVEQNISIRLASTEIARLAEEVEMKGELAARDLVPLNDFNRLVKELEVARLTKDAEEARLARLTVEANAINDGVGQLGGDAILPLEVRLLEYEERLSTLGARAQDLSSQLILLRRTIGPEADRIRRMRELPIFSPVDGRVWRVRARNREFVDVGDPLAEVIRCESLVVSATVSERTFNGLEIRQRVTFESAASDRQYAGKIIQLQGPASGTQITGFAIALREEDESNEYRMIVRLAGFPEDEREPCPVGQTGKVYFAKPSTSILGKLAEFFSPRDTATRNAFADQL